ncbi:cellulose binding domain-containing protein [Paractinoplanes lichenicola]|uniref:Cellulose binding domain-containing protein n=1 Tax=Paractinoplanes lichenicola TaxID=2802976 RepID=A0ABS1VEC0_9ACTN|nr:cellulose binding domain-containing protein [Actinoplanes lichenicola]MBL7253031.1 cellulose binding domain-containing protein [Actinoplanes lichenicola]
MRRAFLIVVALVAAVGGVATAHAATGCSVAYKVTSQWAGGFGAEVTVTNLGDPVTGWTLTWTLASGQGITQAWNAGVTVSGTTVTATNASYNGSVGTGGSAAFGFNGTWSGSNPVPAAFTFNGTACTGGTAPTPTPTPCTGPSTPPATAPVKVWMAGDSTMMNASACPIGWGSQFAPYFTTSVTVQNSAVGGRSIQTWLYEGNVTSTKNAAGECTLSSTAYSSRWTAMLNGFQSGDYLIVQFGINDGDSACPRHVGSARFKELLGVMASAAKARGVKPILVTPVAAITCSGSTAVGNRGFVTETKDAATANGVPVIDLHARSVALYNSLKLCPDNGDYTTGAVGAFFCNDHTHFEAAGANQIAGLIATALREQNIGLAAYLRS